MTTHTSSTARQRLADVLEEASRQGGVQIRRQDGRVYAVTPVAKPARSPFATVTGRSVRGVTSKDLLRAIREEGCFRTKLFLATSDEFTARNAAELCGRRDRLKAHYSVSESGRDAYISLLTGRPTSGRQSLSASKSYAPHHEYIFSPRIFTQLQNAQAIALPYDGINPLPPQYCYLKPHYLDVQTSYFEHLERGAI